MPTYYILLPFIYLLSWIPFPLFYGVSDFMFVMVYHVFGYRKKVVGENLRNAFPEKSEKEIKTIMRRFYRSFCDTLLETFKTLTISGQSAIKRCKLTPEALQLFNRYADENKSIIIVMGHLGNWEWAGNTFSLQCRHHLYVVYHPLSNKYFNGLIYRMRTRFGTGLIAMKDTFREMVQHRAELDATAFIADQTPAPDNAFWLTFLNQNTPVFQGTEKIARKMNYPVVYTRVERVKRGYYEISAQTLFEEPGKTTDGEITMAHTRALEQDIIRQPESWLWSHRRWKHKRPVTNLAITK
ncbi:lipid A biosynthesis acyltransferase [Chitinophaga sp. SYP-B3965]|uniref:lysophospholipid acyltransferase family protein n=1 Tax=Chitinophaga sp. SYP-B3965 TaxID=2663120 RepID=UPI0013B9ECE4|nr:lipid A biosynthesis acyltransferase [Chitinophaga sp. SYP-B3965]